MRIYTVFKFRRRVGDDSDAPPVFGSVPLEILWTAIPAIVVIGPASTTTCPSPDKQTAGALTDRTATSANTEGKTYLSWKPWPPPPA